MKKIVVTGGAGFIGSNLLRTLDLEANQVVVIDDLSSGLKTNISNLNLDFVEGSITNKKLIESVLENADVIVHLAARGSVPRSIKEPITTYRVNVEGSLNILESCRSNNSHLIFISSSSVYGSNPTIPKNEKMWMQPLSPYAASKLSGEAFVNAYTSTYGIRTTPLRLFNVFGPRQRPDSEYAAVLPKWIWKALNNEEIEIYGDGNQTRDFTYVGTVCEVISTAINREIYNNQFTNLAYGNSISLLKVIEIMRKEFPSIQIKHLPRRLTDIQDSQNDPSQIKSLFPHIVAIDFETAFHETLKWLKLHHKKS